MLWNTPRGMTFEEFVEDRKTIDAVIRNFITIGEACLLYTSDAADE